MTVMNPMFVFLFVWVAALVGAILFSLRLYFDTPFLKKMIRMRNDIQGVKSNITPATIAFARWGALAAIVVGFLMLAFFFFGFLPMISRFPEQFQYR